MRLSCFYGDQQLFFFGVSFEFQSGLIRDTGVSRVKVEALSLYETDNLFALLEPKVAGGSRRVFQSLEVIGAFFYDGVLITQIVRDLNTLERTEVDQL